jgi:cystathionine beta-lyase
MIYDFDQIIPRHGTYSVKYDFARERGVPEGLIPMWVADMDFRAPEPVVEALQRVAGHGVFGYSEVKSDYYEALESWFERRFNYNIKREWIKKTPGVVFAIAMAIKAFTKPGDSVLIQTPVYYPFSSMVRENGCQLVDSPLVYKDGAYGIDLDHFERAVKENGAKLFLLCSPHNPVARVWTEEELRAMGEICLRHGCLVLSDEIHCDFVWNGYKHLIFNSLDPRFDSISIIATAPSKTFNLAGIQISNILIPDRDIKKAFSREIDKAGVSQLNVMGLVAAKAAYLYGEEWLEQLKAYMEKNLFLFKTFVKERLPRLTLVEPQGTYLLWVDFRALGLSRKELSDLMIRKAGLWLDEGEMFGPGGAGFQRFNIACPRKLLQKALEQLEKAVNSL